MNGEYTDFRARREAMEAERLSKQLEHCKAMEAERKSKQLEHRKAMEAEQRSKQIEHRKRVRTAIVAIAAIVLSIVAIILVEVNVSHTVAYGLTMAVAIGIAAVLAYEILGLGTEGVLTSKSRVAWTVGLACAPLVVAMPVWILPELSSGIGPYGFNQTRLGQMWVSSLYVVPILAVIMFIAVVAIARPSARRTIALVVLFGLYAVFIVARLPEIYRIPGPWSIAVLVWLMAAVYVADTAAFYIGREFGRRPLAPNISPKKTWEGFFGGVLGSTAVVLVPSLPLLLWQGPIAAGCNVEPCPTWDWGRFGVNLAAVMGIGILIATLGTSGDLLASKLKRLAGVKDSGNLFPGHGGLLDRLDSLLPNALLFSVLPLSGSTFVF